MRLSYITYTIVAVACLALLPSCKESKPQTEEIVVDKVVDKPHNEVQSMSDENINGDVEWIGGGSYKYSVSRRMSESLPKVKNHDFTYYDNTVQLTIRRSDGSVFYDRTFSKKDFQSILPTQFKENGVLLGMNFEEASGNVLKFVVSVGSPDDSYDEYFHILMTVNNFGSISTSVYKAKR